LILVLNGPSSSGKTTLVRALQQRWPRVLLHFGTDFGLQMMPQRLVGTAESAADGFRFCESSDEQGPLVEVRVGEAGRRLEQGLAGCAAALDDEGHDVALDVVLLDPMSVQAYVSKLLSRRTYLIGIECSLAVLEARELARGDRFQNLARSQHRSVHAFREFYDLEIETTVRAPGELARDVIQFVGDVHVPKGMARLAEKLGIGAAARSR
jgi:chloramphenicol 3-O phosphotransferase